MYNNDLYDLNNSLKNMIPNIISFTSDADDAPSGFSQIPERNANNPFIFWCTLLTIYPATQYKQQIAFPWGGEPKLAYRVYDSGTWYPWHYINFDN